MVRQLLGNAGGLFSVQKFYDSLRSSRRPRGQGHFARLSRAPRGCFPGANATIATDSERRRQRESAQSLPERSRPDPRVRPLGKNESRARFGISVCWSSPARGRNRVCPHCRRIRTRFPGPWPRAMSNSSRSAPKWTIRKRCRGRCGFRSGGCRASACRSASAHWELSNAHRGGSRSDQTGGRDSVAAGG